MDNWKQVGMPSNRAEMLSVAVRANMRKRRDLPIAQAIQPVAAVAWAVVDGLADDQQLFAAAMQAQEALALHVGAFPERALLSQVIADCAPEDDAPAADGEAAGEGDEAPAGAQPAEREVA